jgi:hypothetical protein
LTHEPPKRGDRVLLAVVPKRIPHCGRILRTPFLFGRIGTYPQRSADDRLHAPPIAAIRTQIIENGDRFDQHCPHCAETRAVPILDEARDLYVAELQRDDCPRHRVQRIRRVLALIEERFDLLMRPDAPGVH